MLAIVLTVMTVATLSPGKGYAIQAIPPIDSAAAAVTSGNTAVTVTFNTYALPTRSLEDLMSNIEIERSGSTAFTPLHADSATNEISMNADGELVITLGTPLTGSSNAIKVAGGSIMNKQEVPSAEDITLTEITALDVAPPAFTGAISKAGNAVRLNFDEDFTINAPEGLDDSEVNDFLASRLSVATDGIHFVPVAGLHASVYKNGYAQIYLNYDNDMKVILGSATVIRIAGGTLMDSAGNLNAELNLHVSPPVVQGALISNNNHDVVLTFDENVLDNTDGNLRSYIYVVKGSNTNNNWKGLVSQDEVTVEAGKLHIHFAEALTGTASQIMINGGALKDQYGNIQSESRVTPLIKAGDGIDPNPADTTAPNYLYSYVSADKQDVILTFDEDVISAKADAASFLQNVQWYNSQNWVYSLPSDTTVSFSGPKVTLHFAEPLTGNQYYFQFYPDHFQDIAGNKINVYVSTNWFYPSASGLSMNDGYFSNDGRFLSLGFNSDTDLVDQTLVDGISHLNEQITISTDHGATYTALDPLDVVYVEGHQINIIFHNAQQVGSIKVKVAANVLSNAYDTSRNSAVEAEIAYNTPEITGYFFSNTASEFTFTDNVLWREHVRVVRIYDENIDVYRQLNSSEYTLNEGKLTFAKEVFQQGHFYRVSVDAEGFSSKYFDGRAYKSSEVFYTTAPVISSSNGITASMNLFNNAHDEDAIGNQTIIFELFDGTTPVSIVAANLKVNTGTYSASFNVSDGATNPNYTVKAFVVSKYSNDLTNLGLNLATVKTQLELDKAILESNNNKNND